MPTGGRNLKPLSHVQDKPYALFGTCLGAITAYEMARVVEREKLAPMPVALYAAAVSPPHLYAYAVMKLYMTRQLEADEPPPFEEVMEKLRGWDKLPKETLMLVCPLPVRVDSSSIAEHVAHPWNLWELARQQQQTRQCECLAVSSQCEGAETVLLCSGV